MSFLSFGREVTGDLRVAESREWLCANGVGSFASGTVAGALTRRYHGLLVAALQPPLGRHLVVAKIEEGGGWLGGSLRLGTNTGARGGSGPAGQPVLEALR